MHCKIETLQMLGTSPSMTKERLSRYFDSRGISRKATVLKHVRAARR